MGIYSDLKVFGIKLYTFDEYAADDDYNIITFLEKQYDTIMSDEQIREVYSFYKGMDNKEDIQFKLYTEGSSTYGGGPFMMWYPISLKIFLEKFRI